MGLENKISKRSILESVSPLDIFEAYCPVPFKLGGAISSPLREDSSPSFTIGYKNGYYSFYDFSSGDRGDCFDFASRILHKSMDDTILDIVARFNIKPGEVEVVKREFNLEESNEERIIQFKAKPFTFDDINWWGQFGLSIPDMTKQPDVKVYSVEKYWINKKLRFNNSSMCFVYHFETIDKVKIYHPLADRDAGENKWLSNVPLKHMYGLSNLDPSRDTIVTKSLKDLMVLNRLMDNVCGTQNESMASITDENMMFIKNNSRDVYLHGDSDDAGKKYSLAVTKKFSLKYINTPNYLLKFGVTDFADWTKRDGLDAVAYFLKLKNLI